jgi:hypothetical protein
MSGVAVISFMTMASMFSSSMLSLLIFVKSRRTFDKEKGRIQAGIEQRMRLIRDINGFRITNPEKQLLKPQDSTVSSGIVRNSKNNCLQMSGNPPPRIGLRSNPDECTRFEIVPLSPFVYYPEDGGGQNRVINNAFALRHEGWFVRPDGICDSCRRVPQVTQDVSEAAFFRKRSDGGIELLSVFPSTLNIKFTFFGVRPEEDGWKII